MTSTLRAPAWRPLVVLGAVLALLAGCGGDGDERPDRAAGAAGLKAALQETLDRGEQDATMVVRTGTGADEEASVEALRLTGRFDPRAQTGDAKLKVTAPQGSGLDIPELRLVWDPNVIRLDDGPRVARVKARAGNGGEVAAAADQIQEIVDVVAEARSVGQAGPDVWTFEVQPGAGSSRAGARDVWRGEARAREDGAGLEQISLRVPTGAGKGDFRLLLLTLG